MTEVYTNGGYVTRAELGAHLEPMRKEITDTRADVKNVLAILNRQEGRQEIEDEVEDKSYHGWSTKLLLVCTLSSSAVGVVLAHLLGG